MNKNIDFSIITPSYNMLQFLKRCSASIADQRGVSFEHIIVDGLSTDGTIPWLEDRPDIVSLIEEDHGMYDAVNKGLLLAQGEIIAYLNCDEQYLPDTLAYVKEFMDKNPRVDVCFGDTLLVDQTGSLIAHRKAYKPRWYYMLSSHLYIQSCSLFFRRGIIENGFHFDNSLRDGGDLELVVRLLRCGYTFGHCKRYLAVFTITGTNMSRGENARWELRQAIEGAPFWVRAFKVPLNLARLFEKTTSGAYCQRMPIEYAIFPSDEAQERKLFKKLKASFRWPSE